MQTYDLVNAGPNNRFMVNGRIVSNCGRGAQLHNLSRPVLLKTPQQLAEAIKRVQDGLNPVEADKHVLAAFKDLVRSVLMAEPGHVYEVSDFSSIEARVLGWIARDPIYQDAFEKDLDLYIVTAAAIYGVPYDEVTDEQRFLGKACIAEGQLVLTDKGLVPIENIQGWHLVWDGVEWVSHDGLIYQGERNVITYQGLTATPDHRVYTEQGRAVSMCDAASKMVRLQVTGQHGNAIRAVDAAEFGATSSRSSTHGAGPLLDYESDAAGQLAQCESREDQVIFAKRTRVAKCGLRANSRPVRRNSLSLHTARASEVVGLRRAGNYVFLANTKRVYRLGTGQLAAPYVHKTGNRSNRQQRQLRAGEPTIGLSSGAMPKSAQHSLGTNKRRARLVKQMAQPLRYWRNRHVRQARSDRRANTGACLEGGSQQMQGLASYSGKVRVYDLVNAGPRHRFTVSNVLVSNCILGLGYAMGLKKFVDTVAKSGKKVPDELIAKAHAGYRSTYRAIVKLWADFGAASILAVQTGVVQRVGRCLIGVKTHNKGTPQEITFLYTQLPSGRRLAYYEPKIELSPTPWGEKRQAFTAVVFNEKTKQPDRKPMHGGLLAQHACQAIARDLLANGLIKSKRLDVVGHVHDEIIAEMVEGAEPQLPTTMSDLPPWADGLVIKAHGFVDKRYRK